TNWWRSCRGNWRLRRRRYHNAKGRSRNRQEMGANVPNRGTKTVLSGLLNAQMTVYYGLISRVIIRGRSMSTKSESRWRLISILMLTVLVVLIGILVKLD
ncbi:hypothetical protein, partial [Serratia marcescens]